ncbi:MAG: LLM class flavin-dependent oxidoreductase, partial [Acidobacteria bacterium]|nr:LLM class flavin-dependent oxidoreductase [Acidobacteriota bacterium]
LPYHHPFNVAQRIVQLDHLSRGRAMFGSGPGALPSDARTLNIDPLTQRDRQDEALGVIIKLLRGDERFSYESDWFTLHEAALQILPVQENMAMTTASTISPSGMTLAGKYGIGALSIASTSVEGIQALPTQWQFAEDAAAKHGQAVSRANWRVLMSWHIAETREQAKAESMLGLQKWHNEYNVKVLGRPGAQWVDDPEVLFDQVANRGADGGGAAVIGTPDDLIEAILELQRITGGFGVVLGFAHDWANVEATRRSWDLVARYVTPAVNGTINPQIASADYVAARKSELMAGASAAVMSKIMADEKAAAAMATTIQQMQTRSTPKENDPVFRPGGGLPTEA